jgi:hypothetical protein
MKIYNFFAIYQLNRPPEAAISKLNDTPGTDSHWVSGLQLSWIEGIANQSPVNGFGYR